MPGLQQLNKFTEKLLSLGDEPKVRIENGEPRFNITLPTGISETDDSDDFMFGIENFAETSNEAQSADDSVSDTDGGESGDFFSSLPPLREPVGDEPVDDEPTADEEESDSADLDSLFSGLQLPDEFSDLQTSNTPEPHDEEFGSSDDFNLLTDLDLADSLDLPDSEKDIPAAQSEILDEIPQSVDETDDGISALGIPPLPFASTDFDLPADFDLLKDLDLPDGMNISDEIPPLQDNAKSLQDSDLSALLNNVEDLFDGNMPDSPEPSDDLFSVDEVADSKDLPIGDIASLSDFPDDLPDFSGLEGGARLDAQEFPPFDLSDSDFPAPDSLPAIDDLQPGVSDLSQDLPSFDNFGAELPVGDGLPTMDFSSADSDLDSSFSIPDMDADFSASADLGEDPFGDLTGSGFDLPSIAAPTGDEQNVSPEDGDFDFDTNFFPAEDEGSSKSPKIPDPAAHLPNEFTETEYKSFLSNLYLYPLNLRVAIEELIVENQFIDDTVADLIRRVIKKASARQLATHISKLLDKTIQIPRDFEKRTVAQYELYKQSVEYQIKNRVLPAVFLTFAAVILGALFWFVGNRFVYRPIRAEILYNQGYTLLKDKAYSQSEQKFNEAVAFNAVKSWFLKYADGYRTHRQYERARKTYDRGLIIFNNDKKIGLEYAAMELKDLANYARAEQIIKREILDYHINDKDGLLLLGDVYLDWATEKDSSKFEDARKQYASLIEMYGETDLYFSRLMRYFIRTDNLREVLPLKDYFLPKKKALGASDLVELSGYLLEKQHGQLSPADEYLRAYIEDVRTLLERALRADSTSPEAHYNFGKYLVYIGNRDGAKSQLSAALASFSGLTQPRTRTLISKNIDTYRRLGDLYTAEKEYLMAEELYALGIQMYEKEKDVSALVPDTLYGKLYASMGDIDYFISGNMEQAYADYQNAIEHLYDTSSIRYKIGYIQYSRKRYPEALGSFIKTASENPNDRNLLYALGNVLSLRGDNYAAQAYYEMLTTELDIERKQQGVLFPQVNPDQGELVTLYMYVSNNLGVTQYRLAQQTGDSGKNAKAMVCFSDAARAWDALTRNQITMMRLDGSNLAAQNLKYAAFPLPNYQPEIYTDIFRTLFSDPFLTNRP